MFTAGFDRGCPPCFLGGIIYKEEPHSLFNRLCLGFGINASFWSIAVLMVTVQQGYAETLFWIRVSHAVAAATPWFAYALVHCFAVGKKYPSKKVFSLLGGVLALALLSLTPAVIKDVILLPGAKVKVYGPLFPLYELFFTGFPLFSFTIFSGSCACPVAWCASKFAIFLAGSSYPLSWVFP